MYELKINGVPLPTVMVCESRKDSKLARKHGLPFVVKPKGWTDSKLVGAIMFHFLKEKFPYIDWFKVLGLRQSKVDKMIVNVPTEATERITNRNYEAPNELPSMDGEEDIRELQDDYLVGTDEDPDALPTPEEDFKKVNMDEFFQDAVSYVNTEQLAELGLLPTFLADITEAIKRNLIGTAWMDGYNKKLGTTVGEFKYGEEAGNLIILDVSGSIPYGLAYTMCTLIDLLRTQANADLIITGSESHYWACDEELPYPEFLASLVGGCNEASQFNAILENHIFGKTWGNVICFGDMHAPTDSRFNDQYQIHDDLRRNTVVNRIMCYDTRGDYIPGYVLWALPHCVGEVKCNDGTWCNYFRRMR